ncbi:FecR domain-containing protein [Opitutaceae bacterium]|nr:FecR domain-containing protein [Opitutaceae bacterium]
MKRSSNNFPENPEIERAAANWTMRFDRGLTAEEQDAYSQWLAEDPRHRDAIALYRWGWDEFDRLAGLQTTHHAQIDPDLLAPGNRFARRSPLVKGLFAAIPLAASIAIMAMVFWPDSAPKQTPFASKAAIELIARIEQKTLDDGSVIELNRGAVVETQYTPEFRRVTLVRGEANFEVAKDPDRPFVVNVAGVDVRAVGTQFNVRLSDDTVDVIVSEGIVSVSAKELLQSGDSEFEEPLLEVGQRAVMNLGDTPRLDVTRLTAVEMDRELGWQPRLMDFDDVRMTEIVDAFNRSNEVQLVLGDPSLEEMRLSYSLWSDNVEGFVRLMESSFGMRAEWQGSSEIVLRDASGGSL